MTARSVKTGADLFVEVLIDEGVDYVFGNPGTTEMPLMQALSAAPDLRYVLGLQETAVMAMADGYAQATGRPAFVNLHASGGLGHAMGALLHAHVAQTPIVVTAGQQDSRHGVLDPLLSGALTRIAEPAVKWAKEVTQPEQIPILLRRAFNDSRAAPSGPVFLSLPIDAMSRETTAQAGFRSTINLETVATGLAALAQQLCDIAPGGVAIVAGDEIARAGAQGTLVRLADCLGSPAFGPSWPGPMSFPHSHPLWAGNLPTQAAAMRQTLAPFQAVLLLGGHALISYLYSEGAPLPEGCRLFHLSADAEMLGRFTSTHYAGLGHLGATLQALLPLIEARRTAEDEAVAALRLGAARRKAERLVQLDRRLAEELRRDVITPFGAAGQVLASLRPEVAIVDEAPTTMNHVRAFLETKEISRYFFMRSAILGWGLPAAVGVSLGLDRSPVVALLGDGSSLYSPQAFWTAAHLRLPITFVVFNNAEYNILKRYAAMQGFPVSGNAAIPGMDLVDPRIDFPALAQAFGLPARQVTSASDIGAAIQAGVASQAPNLVEILIRDEI